MRSERNRFRLTKHNFSVAIKILFLLPFFFLLTVLPANALQENPEAFIKIADNGYVPFWSPDGKFIVYGGTGDVPCVFKVRIADGYIERMTEQQGFHPVVSPDGKFITYDSLGAQGTLLRILFSDGKVFPLAKTQISGNFSFWAPDGKNIVYNSEGDIWKLDVASERISLLFHSEDNDERPAWSPDGKHIAFDSGDPQWTGNVDIFVMDADGKNLTKLTDDPKIDAQPNWSPDGRWIAFMSEQSGNRDIWIMRADGTQKTQVTYDSGMDVWPRWSPDGKKLAFGSQRKTQSDGTIHIWILDLEIQLEKSLLK